MSKASQPMPERVAFRQPGGWEGQVRTSEDFDTSLPPEIQAAFEGSGDAEGQPGRSAGTAELLAPR